MLIPPPQGLFLGKVARSSIVTETPARASALAAVAPAGPAPTTSTDGPVGDGDMAECRVLKGVWRVIWASRC